MASPASSTPPLDSEQHADLVGDLLSLLIPSTDPHGTTQGPHHVTPQREQPAPHSAPSSPPPATLPDPPPGLHPTGHHQHPTAPHQPLPDSHTLPTHQSEDASAHHHLHQNTPSPHQHQQQHHATSSTAPLATPPHAPCPPLLSLPMEALSIIITSLQPPDRLALGYTCHEGQDLVYAVTTDTLTITPIKFHNLNRMLLVLRRCPFVSSLKLRFPDTILQPNVATYTDQLVSDTTATSTDQFLASLLAGHRGLLKQVRRLELDFKYLAQATRFGGTLSQVVAACPRLSSLLVTIGFLKAVPVIVSLTRLLLERTWGYGMLRIVVPPGWLSCSELRELALHDILLYEPHEKASVAVVARMTGLVKLSMRLAYRPELDVSPLSALTNLTEMDDLPTARRW